MKSECDGAKRDGTVTREVCEGEEGCMFGRGTGGKHVTCYTHPSRLNHVWISSGRGGSI